MTNWTKKEALIKADGRV